MIFETQIQSIVYSNNGDHYNFVEIFTNGIFTYSKLINSGSILLLLNELRVIIQSKI